MSEKDLDVVRALLLLDTKLEAEKLALRASACQIAEKQRQIRKLITEQDKLELVEADKAIDAWTVKTPEEMNKPQELSKMLEELIDRPGYEDHARRLVK